MKFEKFVNSPFKDAWVNENKIHIFIVPKKRKDKTKLRFTQVQNSCISPELGNEQSQKGRPTYLKKKKTFQNIL